MAKFPKYLLGASAVTSLVTAGIYIFKNLNRETTSTHTPQFFKHEEIPYVLAHKGGSVLRPENTKLAFDNAFYYNMLGCIVGVRLTKDEVPIVYDEALLDIHTNGSGYVSEHTYDEIVKLDAGYHFKDINGHTPFRNNPDAKILSLETLLTLYPKMLFILNIKDNPETYLGSIAPTKIYDIIQATESSNRVCVTSPFEKQINRFNLYRNDDTAFMLGRNEAKKVLLQYGSNPKLAEESQVQALMLPTELRQSTSLLKSFIKWLNKQSIITCAMDVNNLDLMNDLIQYGVHTIVTNRPDIGNQFLNR
ncbi:glycerophosphodiester phosphodiesterase family protein [Staphylococcus massiliensis]|uniref:Glycerophosphoryl diester phosphodiesterase n=1 Tax=Staphylococcus massiliensis S46 TaxID=1229783 RepID=K9AXD0_9STAP|nr:glycerophosphodiester phosphodiesterase family protein [Staphylococcus massiliensis]EKU46185.1 glycerophosphoryl diester phosphodiesterase [Staphylococcus massiliensis S46]PNZ99526.1 glycerophosphodiester phosphodiesterase [Staphylococcus massiliensis CCUG 55927]